MEAFQAEIISLAMAVIISLAGLVARNVMNYLNQKGVVSKIEGNKQLAKIVVQAVEQTYSHFEGNQKLNMAKIELIRLMSEKKIKVSEKEVDLLIEAVVREMNNALKETK